MSTVEEICDKVGRVNLAARLGVTKAAITNAISDDVFPSRWYRVVKEECNAFGINCPIDIFGFRKPKSTEKITNPAKKATEDAK